MRLIMSIKLRAQLGVTAHSGNSKPDRKRARRNVRKRGLSSNAETDVEARKSQTIAEKHMRKVGKTTVVRDRC